MDDIEEVDVRHLPDWFWNTIAQAGGDDRKMVQILTSMKTSQIREFDRLFRAASQVLLYTPYYEHLTYPSEDGQQDQANRAVSQGKEYYLNILDHPEILEEMEDDLPDYGPCATYVFVNRHGISIYEEEIYGMKEDESD